MVSFSPSAISCEAMIGPVSIPASSSKRVTPAPTPPERIDCCNGEAPRHFGNKLKWMFHQGNSLSAARGIRLPNATTRASSAPAALITDSSSSLILLVFSTASPRSCALVATGEGVSIRFLPISASGRVITKTTSCVFETSSRARAAFSGVPAKIIFIFTSPTAHSGHP